MNRRVFSSLFFTQIPFKQIFFRLGYPSEERVAPAQKEQIEKLCKEALQIWRPRGVLALEKVMGFEENGIQTENLFLPGKELAKKFSGSQMISLLAVTAGFEAMEWREAFKIQDRYADFTLADAILSEFTDELADSLNQSVLREAHQRGYFLTPRFSPGYGDFPLNFQKNLLDFLRGSEIGISVNSSFLMIPEKSVTAVMGWLKK